MPRSAVVLLPVLALSEQSLPERSNSRNLQKSDFKTQYNSDLLMHSKRVSLYKELSNSLSGTVTEVLKEIRI